MCRRLLCFCCAYGVDAVRAGPALTSSRSFAQDSATLFGISGSTAGGPAADQRVEVAGGQESAESGRVRHLDQVVDAAANARDRFLVVLLLQTGLRIGEALGLRRNDLHFLPGSRNAGCRVRGRMCTSSDGSIRTARWRKVATKERSRSPRSWSISMSTWCWRRWNHPHRATVGYGLCQHLS